MQFTKKEHICTFKRSRRLNSSCVYGYNLARTGVTADGSPTPRCANGPARRSNDIGLSDFSLPRSETGSLCIHPCNEIINLNFIIIKKKLKSGFLFTHSIPSLQ